MNVEAIEKLSKEHLFLLKTKSIEFPPRPKHLNSFVTCAKAMLSYPQLKFILVDRFKQDDISKTPNTTNTYFVLAGCEKVNQQYLSNS